MKKSILPGVLFVSTAALSGCAAQTVLTQSCPQPAPLDGKYDPQAPGYIVQFRDSIQDVALSIHDLALKYSFKPTAIYKAALKGFAVHDLKQEALAGLRCEPEVLGISLNQRTTVAGHAL